MPHARRPRAPVRAQGMFLITLSAELANEEKPPEGRRLAGIIVKNCLDSKVHPRVLCLLPSRETHAPRRRVRAFRWSNDA